MNKYFKLDSRKLTYREYWNINRSWSVIIPWTAKLLGIPLHFASGMPYFESVKELEVSEENFSLDAYKKLFPLLEKCEKLGFHSPRFFTYVSMKGDIQTSFIALLHPSGATVRLMHSMALKVHPPKQSVSVILLTELRDGSFLVTSGKRQQFINQPNVAVNRLIGATPEQLVQSHLQKVAELPMNNPPKSITSVDLLDGAWDRYEREAREFGMKRGIYVWMTSEEVAKEQAAVAEVSAMSGGDPKNRDVLIELNNLRNKKASWSGAITLFVISLLLFIFFRSSKWSWSYLVILMGVLLVHETGHYIAMRAFHYQNLRMFFIPFFGAAVSGRHYNVAGWKKVVVSLMGPLPGIVLGIILGVGGLVVHQMMLVKIAVVSLFLNGFNLLPILPLDGGWVFHTLIFSRHYILDVVFRVLAAVALIVSAVLLQTKTLPYVGLAMLIGLPAAYRMARIAGDLKKRQLPPVSESEQNIPPETADAIIAEVRNSTTKPQSTKVMAQQTLQIFETLNAHPPGWAASLGLLFVHLAALGAAVVFGVAFIIAQRGDFRDLLSMGANMPKHKLAAGPWPVLHEQAAATNGIVVVANFSSASAASAFFQETSPAVPVSAAFRLFGESVLLSLPSGNDDMRKAWLTNFQARCSNVFVDTTNYHAAVSMLCIAPDTNAAENIVHELNCYLSTLPDQPLIPPWQPADKYPPSARAHDDLARQTYLKVTEVQSDGFDNPELTSLEKKLTNAARQGDDTSAAALQKQIQLKRKEIADQNLELLRSGSKGPVDTNVIDLYVKMNTPEMWTNFQATAVLRHQLAEHMGLLAATNGQMASDDERIAASGGFATRKGLVINLGFLSFYNLVDGPPALAEWLRDKHCIGFRYNFFPGIATGKDVPDE